MSRESCLVSDIVLWEYRFIKQIHMGKKERIYQNYQCIGWLASSLSRHDDPDLVSKLQEDDFVLRSHGDPDLVSRLQEDCDFVLRSHDDLDLVSRSQMYQKGVIMACSSKSISMIFRFTGQSSLLNWSLLARPGLRVHPGSSSQASPQSSRRIITPVIDSIIGRQQNYHLHCITGQMQWWGWGEFCWLLLVPDPKMLDS